MTTHPAPRRPIRRFALRVALTLLVGIVAIAALAAAWWMWSASRPGKLDPGWTAVVRVLAGDGIGGVRDGDRHVARFSDPFDVAVGADGTIYVADGGTSHRIRAIAPDGRVSTIAGGRAGFADGPGWNARFDMPSGLAIDASGTLYVADTGNNAIRRITADGHVSTIAGNGLAGYQDGAASQARFNGPLDVAVDPSGRIIVADTYNDRIRAIGPDGKVRTVAGTAMPGFVDGGSEWAAFDTPGGVAMDPAGNILVADSGNAAIRRIEPQGTVSTLPGSLEAGLVRPVGIAVSATGDLYVADDAGRILEITSAGKARTLAGSTPGFGDGSGAGARFRRPTGVALRSEGRLVVADAGNALVRLVSAPERLESAVPASPFIRPRFDAAAFTSLPLLWPAAPMEGPHEIAGTMGEARGGEGSERFHAGVDIRLEDGTPVLAVRDGVVTSIVSAGEFGSLNEWLRIGDIAYVHVRVGRTRDGRVVDTARFAASYDEAGAVVRTRVKRGARFRTGDFVATANRFNHVHLNVGWPGEEHNALRFRLVHFEDHQAPTIARGGIKLFDENGQPLVTRARGRLLVSGRVQIVVDAWDQADGNRPNRRLGLYAVGYGVLKPDRSPVPGFERTTENIRFDRLSNAPDAARLVYAPGSGIPYYGRRVTRFLYIATNIFRDGLAMADYWDTSLLPPGDYVLRVYATDVHGNAAVANRDLPVTIVSPPIAEAGAH